MRNDFGTARRTVNYDLNETFADRVSSLDQAAVVWSGDGEVVAASPLEGRVAGSYEIDVARFPTDFNLAAAMNMRRSGRTGVPPLSAETLYLTTVTEYSERTRILALDGEKLALDDDELAEWLIEAERQVFIGTDNHPLFETSLEETACCIRRLPNGQVSMTEVPRKHVLAARERMRGLLGDQMSSHMNLCVETPLRSTARYFLTALGEGDAALRPGKEHEVTAFLVISRSGFSYGLWSPATGLFSEYAFLSPIEIDPQARSRKEGRSRYVGHSTEDETLEKSGDQLHAYVRDAFNELFMQLSPEKLEALQLSTYAQIVWAAEPGLSETIFPVAEEYSEKSGLEIVRIEAPLDETSAGGLLFGSFSFGEIRAAGAEILPPVNLAHDILVLADTEEIERRREEELRLVERRNKAVFTLLAAPVMAAAMLLAIVGYLMFSQVITAVRNARADAKTQELKPALDRRKAYEANLKWYQEFITQVSSLRRQQPVGIGLLYELNSNYPTNIDPSFYVSDMKMNPDGSMEMKGLARNKDAIATFLKSLEFAGGPESGSRLFSNLAYEVQESVQTPNAAGAPNVPVMTGSALTGSTAAPGVISWSIKGNYLPMAEFAPPDPKAKPAATPAPAPAPAKPAQ